MSDALITPYSTCKFSVPEPKVIWELTNACNYTCNYCVFASTARIPAGELSLAEMQEVCDSLVSCGFSYVKFTGGEPFLRPDLLEILEYAHSRGIRFDLSTNASLLTEEGVARLRNCSPNFVHVSLDGASEKSHEAVRGKRTFRPTLNGLTILSKAGLNIRVGAVVHDKNQSELQSIIRLAHEHGAAEVIFSLLEPAGRQSAKASMPTLDLEHLLAQLKGDWPLRVSCTFNKNTGGGISDQVCPAGSRFLFINSVGDVLPCTWLAQQNLAGGRANLRERSLDQILKAKTFTDIRAAAENNPGKCLADSPQLVESYFSKLYLFATENLGLLKEATRNVHTRDRALTTTGSFDQALVLAETGFRKIHCVDINPLAQYYAELKLAALTNLDMSAFKKFFLGGALCFDFRQYKKLEPGISASAAQFWRAQYVKHNYLGSNLRTAGLFRDQFSYNLSAYEENSWYLRSEENYANLQKMVNHAEFYFEVADIAEGYLTEEVFDFIYLSNVADYAHKIFNGNLDYVELFRTKCLDRMYGLLTSGGVLAAAYVYDVTNKLKSSDRSLVNCSTTRGGLWGNWKNGSYSEVCATSVLPGADKDALCCISRFGDD